LNLVDACAGAEHSTENEQAGYLWNSTARRVCDRHTRRTRKPAFPGTNMPAIGRTHLFHRLRSPLFAATAGFNFSRCLYAGKSTATAFQLAYGCCVEAISPFTWRRLYARYGTVLDTLPGARFSATVRTTLTLRYVCGRRPTREDTVATWRAGGHWAPTTLGAGTRTSF